MNEAETRAELIDPLLAAAGWGVVEAKPDTAPLSEGVAQAKEYAGKLQRRFTCSSNGLGVYAIDMATGEEGPVAGLPHAGGALGAHLR
jgi:type I restriction enzyme R subunit